MTSTVSSPGVLALLPLLVLLFATSVEVAQAQGLPGILWLQMKGYTVFTHPELDLKGVSVTYDSAETLCIRSGGVPASNPNTAIDNHVASLLIGEGVATGTTFFTGSSAQPSSSNPASCAQRQPSTSAAPNSANCYYRWRYGFYDMFAYNGEPGTAYWQNLYFQKDGPDQVLNFFEQYVWNGSNDKEGRPYPRGYYGGISGIDVPAATLIRMDSPHIPMDNDPNPLSQYVVVCEVQMYPQLPPVSTRMPQPTFVKGFKELTWSQVHWWVFYLIAVTIVLLLLIITIVYCCCTATKPKENPPLFQMVIRERVGGAYVTCDQLSQGTQPPEPYEATIAEEKSQTLPSASGVAEEVVQPLPHEGKDLDARQTAIAEDVVEEEIDGTSSASPGSLSSTRRSVRRGRGRPVVQHFAEVVVPRAGQIDEAEDDL